MGTDVSVMLVALALLGQAITSFNWMKTLSGRVDTLSKRVNELENRHG